MPHESPRYIASYWISWYWRCLASYPYHDNSLSNESIFHTTLKQSSTQQCRRHKQKENDGRGVTGTTFQGGPMHSTDHPDVQNARYRGLMFVSVSSPIHLKGHCRLTYAFVTSLHFRITVAELSNEVSSVAARHRTDYQTLIVGTKVQPVCSHIHIRAIAGRHPRVHSDGVCGLDWSLKWTSHWRVQTSSTAC